MMVLRHRSRCGATWGAVTTAGFEPGAAVIVAGEELPCDIIPNGKHMFVLTIGAVAVADPVTGTHDNHFVSATHCFLPRILRPRGGHFGLSNERVGESRISNLRFEI